MDKEIFIKYFNGTISSEEEKQLLSWIETSEENKQLFMQERQLWDLLLLNYPEEINLNSDQTNRINNKTNTAKRILLEIAKIAAIFLVAISVSFYFLSDRNEASQDWNTIEVPLGQRTHITLSDGTKVWLNAKTKFTFPDHFNKENRLVKLDGEAIFDVTHNEKSPFIVETEKFNVKVMGTEFNVYAYSQSNSFETTLIRGKVAIEKSNSAETAIELSPSHMAQYNELTGKLELKQVNTQQSVFWREGIYSFENETLSSIFQRLERYYEVEFDVKNRKILQDNFTGKFRYRDPIEIILEVVKKSNRFRYSKNDNKITIY